MITIGDYRIHDSRLGDLERLKGGSWRKVMNVVLKKLQSPESHESNEVETPGNIVHAPFSGAHAAMTRQLEIAVPWMHQWRQGWNAYYNMFQYISTHVNTFQHISIFNPVQCVSLSVPTLVDWNRFSTVELRWKKLWVSRVMVGIAWSSGWMDIARSAPTLGAQLFSGNKHMEGPRMHQVHPSTHPSTHPSSSKFQVESCWIQEWVDGPDGQKNKAFVASESLAASLRAWNGSDQQFVCFSGSWSNTYYKLNMTSYVVAVGSKCISPANFLVGSLV